MTEKNLADTRPTKEYLVHGITQDVSVEECIFDLIDNSIDAYPRHSNEIVSKYDDYTIDLTLEKNLFYINDCGKGIDQLLLQNDTLRFGTKTDHHTTSIGFYGIGLNRAIFKLGKKINITTETKKERSIINLDVSKFLKDNENWSLPIISEQLKGKNGTFIKIENLNSEINDSFTNPEWINSFCNQISIRYSEFLKKNLKIRINEKEILPYLVSIRTNSGFKPLEKEFTHKGIKVIISLGQSAEHFFTYEKSYNLEKNATPQECGWFVYCNDRAVKLFDWTPDTGWHTKFHSEHTGFIGKAYFIGNAGKLPWNTSKTDVDLNNETYKKSLETMKKFSEDWRKHTTKILKRGYRPITDENPVINDLFGGMTQQHGTQNPQQGTQDPQLGTQDPQLGTQDPQLGTQDPQLGTQDPQLGTQDPQLGTQDPQLGTQDPQLGTQDPQLGTQDPQLGTQYPQQGTQDDEELPSHQELLYDIPEHALNQNQLFESFPDKKSPFNIPLNEKKLCSIINEMSKLKLDPNKGSPYAVLFLLRAFIELSCKYYIKAKNSKIDLNQCSSLADQVKRCLDHMISENVFNAAEDSRDIDALRSLCIVSPSQRTIRNIQYLQNTLHHPRNIWDKDNINAFWYSILPFLIKCYE
ncbi:ATP-binding protein [Acinetobacter dispersus]|uniref:ATP-binding protein n=1 Tax=Acinetobacter dispersus TaxID=70348 RepID=UPI003C2E3858